MLPFAYGTLLSFDAWGLCVPAGIASLLTRLEQISLDSLTYLFPFTITHAGH